MITIKIAGLSIGIESYDEVLAALIQPYRSDDQPCFTIAVTQKELAAEEAISPGISESEALSLATYRKICTRALEYDCILFHSSAVEVDGRGYLFAAPSGTGKSTHASLWGEMLGSRLTWINDDKPLLRLMGGVWFVCGTPWNGKHGLGGNLQVPVQGICFLEQAKSNEMFRIDSQSAIPMLLNQMLRPSDLEGMDRLLKLSEGLLKGIPMWRLRCLPNRSAAMLCYEFMKGV